jgi:SAM-dependent methyltransferase
MGIIGDRIGYLILKAIAPKTPSLNQGADQKSDTTLGQSFGEDFFRLIAGKTVIDFGCGCGNQAVEMAVKGAGKVIGLDIQERFLEIGRVLAQEHSVADRCLFTTSTDELADIIVSKDAFEHFNDPADILQTMSEQLKPDGFILASFGPTWLHPFGGHLFSVFPWAHLLFNEDALIRWRSDFKSDGASKFSEVAGGLNRMTIGKFEQLVGDSPCRIEWLDTIPIKGIRFLKHKAFREMGSAIVRCKLVPRANTPQKPKT